MKTSNIILLNILITLVLLSGFYYAINNYGTQFLTGIWDKNGVTKVINQKVIQQNVSEYRKLSDTQSDVTKAISTVAPATVHIIKSTDVTSTLSGGIISSFQGGATAIILTSDGYLLTNKHVVNDLKAKYVVITSKGKKLSVSNIWHDPLLDLAVVKVTDATGKSVNDLPTANFVSADSVINLGQFAIVLGSSQTNKEFISSLGTVNQKNSTYAGNTGDSALMTPLYSIDAQIQPGFSGGPTMDIEGNVIAITTAMFNGEQQGGLILPVTKEMIQSMLKSIISQGKIVRNPFGATTLNINDYVAQQLSLKKSNWLLVQKVTPNSFAAQIGLQRWDIITNIGNSSITDDTTTLSRYWFSYSSGDTLELSISRQGETQKLTMTLTQ